MAKDIVLLGRVPAEEYWQEGYDGRRYPAGEQHAVDDALRYADRIAERLDDGVVTIHRDEHEMEDRARAEVDVEGVPDVAHVVAEHPAAGYLDRGVEGHGEHGDEHVREGERDDEVVGHDAELAMPDHRDHDEEVAEHRGGYYRAEEAAQ